jgi:hypothetical protein
MNYFINFCLLFINNDNISSSVNSLTTNINFNFDILKAKVEFSSGMFIIIFSAFKSLVINRG